MSGLRPVVIVPEGWGRPWHKVFTFDVIVGPLRLDEDEGGISTSVTLSVASKPEISCVGLCRWVKYGILRRSTDDLEWTQ